MRVSNCTCPKFIFNFQSMRTIISTEGQLKECSKEFPKFLVKPDPSVDIELGDELRLTCIGTGDICTTVNAP